MTDEMDPVQPPATGVGVAYPPPPGGEPGGHHRGLRGKLSNLAIVTIAVGIAVLAGGIVALVVLLGNHTPSRLGPPPAAAAAAAAQPSAATPGHVILMAKHRGKTHGRLVIYNFGHGVKLLAAPGWTSINNVPNGTNLLSPDQGAELFAELFPSPNATDPSAEFGNFSVSWLSNIQVDSSTLTTESITDSPYFTKDAYEQYSATQSSNQGTQQVYGFFFVALDPNNFEVFGVYEATSVAEYNKNAKTAINMIITATG